MQATCDTLDDIFAAVPEVAKSKASKSKVIPVPFVLTAPVTESVPTDEKVMIEVSVTKIVTKDVPVVDLFKEAKSQAEDWAAKQSLYGGMIKAAAEPLRIAEGIKAHDCVQTLNLGDVRYTAQNKFNPIEAKDLLEVSRVFGADYERFILTKTEFFLNTAALEIIRDGQDEKAKQKIREAMRTLSEYGAVTRIRSGHATNALYTALSMDETIRAKAASVGLCPQQMLVVK